MAASETDARRIARLLVARGRREFESNSPSSDFTADALANALVTDFRKYPHAFVIACIMDRQIKAERAWEIPFRIQERLGSFEFLKLERLSERNCIRLMRRPSPLHRYPETMGKNMHAAIALIAEKYGGDASQIWRHRPSSAEIVLRFLEFPGVGPKIATMAANLLVRKLKVPLSDYYSIDVSVDVHVRRVLTRLGLVEQGASLEQIVYAARAFSPEFPGLIDSPAFQLGRTYCRPRKPRCAECYMRQVCPDAGE